MDWLKVQSLIETSDIVLTVPAYADDPTHQRQPDNDHNTELAQRLERSSRFMNPIKLRMGPAGIEVAVFVRKRS